ncbi:glycosyl hydrolase family 18 protein [Kitasatospora sp. NPDC088351]|uniref:glycoside hydrolase family 18 protein n=1 Tax=Kitasatospora sp. NPDC088351 TaxID=3155180 RepID=UPI0034166289
MSELVHSSDPGTTCDGQVWGKGAAEKTYQANGFDPAKTDHSPSFTPGRVAKTVFNTYRSNGDLTVSGFLTDFSAYDSRLGSYAGDTNVDHSVGGRGIDAARLAASGGAFDEVVVSFAGIIGDQGEKRDFINRAAIDFKIASSESDLPNQRGAVTFIDAWGDVLAYLNLGFNRFVSDDAADMFDPAKAQGLLGAVNRLHHDNPDLKVGLTVGGWTMSQAFHHITKEPQSRARFTQSLQRIFRAFPMFTTLHLDWEWPGSQGAEGNDFGPEDAGNYATLIRETKAALPDATIAVAIPAEPDRLRAMNVPALLESGAGRLDLMAYDLFASPSSPALGHQAGLYGNPDDPNTLSIDKAVTYLLAEAQVPSRTIHLSYTTYSRNARQATVSSASPLRGTYNPGPDGATVGSFESGVSDYADILRNYLDLERQSGRNGFTLYTDTTADADYLYNPDSQVYMSLDTPRSVRAKAEYARTKGLGGLFAWTADTDTGLLANAAREGLGHTLANEVVDMKPFYINGTNQ